MKVSVVINTLNRADDLQRTLASFALQRYRDFELIVVNGPSEDRTPKVMNAWRGAIKTAYCPEANLSMSRNIGIAAATGDIVAFIDDDAIPEPIWLQKIVEGYSAAEVGGVGGWVHDATGHAYQTKYILCNRFAASRTDMTVNPTPHHNCPGTVEYCSLLGTNSSFRRDLLVEIGGFDEEFAYYLDETDVCLRIVDRGYRVVFLEEARVLHKFAASHMRNTRKVLRNRYQIIKNQCYFSFLHGGPAEGYAKALAETQKFVTKHREDVKWCISEGYLDADASLRFEDEAEQGIRDGLQRAFSGAPSHRPAAFFGNPSPFQPFQINGVCENALTIVLLSQSYPPGYVDGIGRFTAELAAGLAELGHEVHVITSTYGHDRVDLEGLVWVHRVKPLEEQGDADVPPGIWSKSSAAAAEISRIQETASIDVIQAPAWDAEGIAALRRLKTDALIITSLHTPMMVAAATHPNWLVDHSRMVRDILPIMRLERELFVFSDGVYANSSDIVTTVQSRYDIEFERLHIVPHGLRDRLSPKDAVAKSAAKPATLSDASAGRMRVLFVGRLETRKGIDVVLAALPKIFERLPDVEFWLVGQDHTENADGQSTLSSFQQKCGSQPWFAQLHFFGKVEKEFLDDFYSQCDLVVMPSRYESFGLVLLEAMMHGLPVVAAEAGGMKEVVVNGETGILVPPGEFEPFADAVITLGLDPEVRRRYGANGRKRFEEKFTATVMARDSIAMYRDLLAAKQRGQIPNNRVAPLKSRSLSRAWSLSDFWHVSPLKSWVPQEWFFASVPIWIALLAREALFRSGIGDRRRVLVIGSTEPLDFVNAVFPNAVHIARKDIPNRGAWADSEVVKRDLWMIGLKDEDFDLVIVLKPLPDNDREVDALRELARLVRPSGVLAVLVNRPLRRDRIKILVERGFRASDFEQDTESADGAKLIHSVVVTRASAPNVVIGPASAGLASAVAVA